MKRQILISSLILLFIQTLASAGVLYVPSRDYPTIQSAIDDAVNGDVVVVAPGTYSGHDNVDLDFSGGNGQSAITVKSEINPDNPEPGIISATIIDCQGTRYNPHRAFWFHSSEGPNSKVLGFTITNGYARYPVAGDPGRAVIVPPDMPDPYESIDPTDPNGIPRGERGKDASGDGYGGAILCDGASSPTIQYCVISNCIVTGGQGGDGAPGQWGTWTYQPPYDVTDPNADVPEPVEVDNGQWGGHGGAGEGNGHGGAIACRGGSSPIISDCTISDNFARGGSGGNGGNGGFAAEFPDYDQGIESAGGNAGDSIGDGIGGGIYCEGSSSPTITNCTFSNNIATTGVQGTGGQRGLGNITDPLPLEGLDSLVSSTGGIAGGAAYYSTSSDANFTNCTFTSNKSYEVYAYEFYSPISGEKVSVSSSAYTVGGALYSVANNTVTLDTCVFAGNLGGAVYCDSGCNLSFDDCSFSDNSETANGGALHIGPAGSADIQNCIFSGNSAYDDGGALKCESNITLKNCSFGGNRADSDNDGWGYGGAMDAYQPGTTLVIDANSCSFAANQSIYGGGFSSENFEATFTDCYFIGNTAQGGGGLDLVNGDISVTGGAVKANDATDGDGGGFNCRYTIAEIRDCTISDNFVDGIYPTGGSGGAINFYGGPSTQEVFNCLITGNYAAIHGGAIFCRSATPEIGNCTFSGNLSGGYGGAIFSDWSSDPQITDSIFQNNNSHAIHEQNLGGDALVKYSLFYNNPDGDYYDSGTGLTYTGAGGIGSIPGGVFNLYGDPLFVSGPLGGFYLRQQPVQPLPQSPAVDTGSADANDPNIGLDTYTTRTDSANDVNLVDRGYHYIDIAGVDTFQLTASVIGGQGTIEPGTGSYYAGTVVTLTATPDGGWRLKAWRGTDDDSSTAETSSVVMNSDRTVTVEFEQPRTLDVPGDYTSIQLAIDDAKDGDVIVINPGTYSYEPGQHPDGDILEIHGKAITLTSANPDDPSVVAATVLECRLLISNVGRDTIIDGLTIQNPVLVEWFMIDPDGPGADGIPGIGYEGGGMMLVGSASPTVRNCVFDGCYVWGAHGSNGNSGTDYRGSPGNGGWAGWARGGAVRVGDNGSPIFKDCSFVDCWARGGDGGNAGDDPGGHGGNWSEKEYWDETSWIWDYGPFQPHWKYSGYGGAVYCNPYSSPEFEDCTFTNNHAYGGSCGISGQPYTPTWPLNHYKIDSFGGAVYGAEGSSPAFTGCVFTDNQADIAGPNSHVKDDEIPINYDPYISYGGAIAFEDGATPTFDNCTFNGNLATIGGGMWWTWTDMLVADCNFVENLAAKGGGVYFVGASTEIVRSNFSENQATFDINEAAFDINEGDVAEGGAIYCFDANTRIVDCNITTNDASGSGGGIYLGGSDTVLVKNSLITNNTAGRDGGGISANWYSQPDISNCTIADNIVTGVGFDTGYGGGLYCSYDSYTNIINSIIWGNFAGNGSQLAIGSGDPYKPRPSTVNVSHSAIGPRYAYLGFISDASFAGGLQQGGGTTLVEGQTIYGQFDAGQERVKVIVSLFEPVEMRQATDWDSPESVATLRAEIASRQSAVLSSLTSGEFTLRYRYDNQAGFSGEVTIGGLNKLLSNPSVAHIEPVRYVQPLLAQAIPLANALEARQVYDGTGIAVAIVDSGVDYTHPRLGNDGFPNNKVIGGYDTGNNDADPMPVGEAHGTACAGIAAGDLGTVGDYIGGVAPSAKIYALKLTTDAGLWPTDSAVASWDWSVTHHNDDPCNPLKVMSNSWALWGVPFNDPVQADAVSPALTAAADSAVAAGITILAGSGNDGFAGQGVTWPSAMSKVISVGAVYDTTDMVTGYSNTADNLDILAPADPVYTTDIVGSGGAYPGDYWPDFGGTSAACPFAAGAVAGLQSAALAETGSYLTPAQVRDLLVVSGDPVTDAKVAITKPRVNLGRAIDYLTAGPIYIEEGSQIEHDWWDPESQTWDPNSNNLGIDEDPLFIAGYFLSQVAAGQLFDSNCVDAGSDLAANLGLDTYTTRTDSFPDTYDPNNPDPCSVIVDMGYHYPLFEPPRYELTVTAIEVSELPEDEQPVVEPNAGFYNWYTTVTLTVTTPVPEGYQVLWSGTNDDGLTGTTNTVTMDSDRVVTVTFVKNAYDLTVEVVGSGGSVSPIGTHTYPRGTVVNLTAYPDEDYRFKQWTGTDNDASTATTNTVTMYSDKTVTVEFELPATITVPGDYPTIEEAIVAARDRDKIVIATGTYYPGITGLVIDKEITLTSTNPDDPDVVAMTIIDPIFTAFDFMSNAGPGTVLNGITIANANWGIIPAEDGEDPGENGQDGGSIQGGAIYCWPGSSPTIKNCIIRDCSITGGDAGSGADANEGLPGGRGGWAGWARGGGVYVASGSSPTFINCTISNCSATGGNAGDGGNGAEGETDGIPWELPPGYGGNWSYGILWQLWGYIGDYRYYSAYGGGVYCDVNSTATFKVCTITGNSTQGGMSGVGGLTAVTELITDPVQSFEIPSYGGGVYCGAGSTVVFEGCTITNNEAPKPSVDDANEVVYHLNPHLGHGGGVAFEKTASVTFKKYVSPTTGEVRRCVISGNLASVGGGMYWADPCTAPEISDCNFSDNLAYQGGGLFGTNGSAIIENCIIQGNFAGTAPNDVDDVAGQGGGIYSASMVAEIIDCNISDNEAGASGGGIFFTGVADDLPIVANCLVTDNEAGRDGGGISVNWYAEPIIANCTVVGNQATGDFGEIGNTGFGGGLYSSYHSNSEVIDSIFWNNSAVEGDEIAVGTGFEFDPRPATLKVTYSDIRGGRPAIQVDTGCTLLWDVDPGDPDYPTNINTNPLFATGPVGDYYLSQTDAGQAQTSPCVDTGSDLASNLGMNLYTTRTDEVPDRSIVDMGYHYPLRVELCSFCDLVPVRDGIINFKDYAILALHWRSEGCSDANGWCEGADLTFDGNVDFDDLAFFVECWLVEDTKAPEPDPSVWKIKPHSTSTTSINMTAETSFDAWWGSDVQYYFESVTDDVNSGWRNEPNWPHTISFDPNAEYGYRVRARDRSSRIPDDGTGEPGNKTGWSAIRYVIPGEAGAAEPPAWVLPYVATPNSITLEVTTSDSNGIGYAEYYFEEISGNPGGSDSGWQSEPNYTDTGLDPNTTYTYRVRALDVNDKITAWSVSLDATTLEEGAVTDTTPPTPDPMQWDETITPTGLPTEIYGGCEPYSSFCFYARMTAVAAADPSGGVEYRFICTTNGGFSSEWQSSNTYTVLVGASGQAQQFYVIARDLYLNETGEPYNVVSAVPR